MDLPAAWCLVQNTTRVLQTQAKQQLHSGQAAEGCMRSLLYIDHARHAALALYAGSPKSKADQNALSEALHAAVGRARRAAGMADLQDQEAACAQQRVEEERRMHLVAETDGLHALASAGTLQPQQAAQLCRAISHLRAWEAEIDLHASMAKEVQEFAEDSDFSDTNFAYGSTPYSSWLQVMQHPGVAAAVTTAMARPARTCMVWGSSLGWLVLFAALTFRWATEGYELLACLHDRAMRLREELGLQDLVGFSHADMLTSRLADVGVLLMADQCWDADLVLKAVTKALEELPEGAVAISYRSKLPQPKLRSPVQLEPVAEVSVPVSWNEDQRLHVYKIAVGRTTI